METTSERGPKLDLRAVVLASVVLALLIGSAVFALHIAVESSAEDACYEQAVDASLFGAQYDGEVISLCATQ